MVRLAKKEPGKRKPLDREKIKQELLRAFRQEFREDTVDISDGYGDNIHVMVVSRRFDELTDRQRQDWMWQIVDSTSLNDAEKGLISLLYPLSPAQIK